MWLVHTQAHALTHVHTRAHLHAHARIFYYLVSSVGKFKQ